MRGCAVSGKGVIRTSRLMSRWVWDPPTEILNVVDTREVRRKIVGRDIILEAKSPEIKVLRMHQIREMLNNEPINLAVLSLRYPDGTIKAVDSIALRVNPYVKVFGADGLGRSPTGIGLYHINCPDDVRRSLRFTGVLGRLRGGFNAAVLPPSTTDDEPLEYKGKIYVTFEPTGDHWWTQSFWLMQLTDPPCTMIMITGREVELGETSLDYSTSEYINPDEYVDPDEIMQEGPQAVYTTCYREDGVTLRDVRDTCLEYLNQAQYYTDLPHLDLGTREGKKAEIALQQYPFTIRFGKMPY